MTIKTGDILLGNIEKLLSYGAFLTLPEGKNGLLHVSELPAGFKGNIKDVFNPGQELKVKVLKIDEKGKIFLSMRFGASPSAAGAKSDVIPAPLFGETGTVITEDKDFDRQLLKFSRRNKEKLSDVKKQFYGKIKKRGK